MKKIRKYVGPGRKRAARTDAATAHKVANFNGLRALVEMADEDGLAATPEDLVQTALDMAAFAYKQQPFRNVLEAAGWWRAQRAVAESPVVLWVHTRKGAAA